MYKRPIEFIQVPRIPKDIFMAIRPRVRDTEISIPGEERIKEKEGGRGLIRDIVSEKLGSGSFRIIAEDNRKPAAFYENREIHITIAHCGPLLCGAVSENRKLGIDLEFADRKVHPALKKRITHPEEVDLVHSITALQLWTLKEAAVKWSGSGLRTALNRIRVSEQNDLHYRMVLPDGTDLELFSLQLHNHWLSIAYD